MSKVPVLIKTVIDKSETKKSLSNFEKLVKQSLLTELKNNGIIESDIFYEAFDLMSEKEKY